MYWLVAGVFLLGFLLIHRIVHSPFGQVLKAIRENEPRATSLGYRTDDYKWVAFVLSTFLAGIAGGAKSLVFGIATLTDVHWTMHGEVVLMSLVGGLGTVFGPVAGALILTAMENYLAQFGAWVTVTQGVIFVLCVVAFRRGRDRRARRGVAAEAVILSNGVKGSTDPLRVQGRALALLSSDIQSISEAFGSIVHARAGRPLGQQSRGSHSARAGPQRRAGRGHKGGHRGRGRPHHHHAAATKTTRLTSCSTA